MFPLGPPGLSNSPYQVLSAFAGNPLFISLDKLVNNGFLSREDLVIPRGFDHGDVRYEAVWKFKKRLFRKAFARFETEQGKIKQEFFHFCSKQKSWLDDYALFCALKEKHRGASWTEWEPDCRQRKPSALAQVRVELNIKIRYHQFLQFQFYSQWRELKNACAKRGVDLIGDIPIFVAHDSADVWANPDLFWLDKSGRSLYVAGVPPDYFSRTGQRWGNPLYRWDVLRRQGYAWWIRRFQAVFQLFDATRLDHFIGFHNYWRIPAQDKTAVNGKWVAGPGAHFFEAISKKLGHLPLIAEDLGAITDPVRALRDRFNIPGMAVLQFAFSGDMKKNPFLPHNFQKRLVVYTGTHDNDTTCGWYRSLKASERATVTRYLNSRGKAIHWDMIRLALASTADTAITPVQDLLGLGSRARMNRPGTPSGNWGWRLRKGALTSYLARRLAQMTQTYGRS